MTLVFYHFSDFSYRIKLQLPPAVSGLIVTLYWLFFTVSLSHSSTIASQVYLLNHLLAFESLSSGSSASGAILTMIQGSRYVRKCQQRAELSILPYTYGIR